MARAAPKQKKASKAGNKMTRRQKDASNKAYVKEYVASGEGGE